MCSSRSVFCSKAACGVLLVALACRVALGEQLFQTASVSGTLQFPGRDTNFSRTDTDVSSVDFLIPRFDPSQGTLNSVTLGYATSETPFFAAQMFAPPSIAAGVNANVSVTYDFTVPGLGSKTGERFFNQSRTINAPNSSTDILYATQTFDSGLMTLPASANALYSGSGQIELPYSIVYEQEATISNTGMVFAFGSTTATDLLVIYDFTPPPPVAGDYDGDGIVGQSDYQEWSQAYGSTQDLEADGNGDGVVDAGDYTVWRDALAASVASTTSEPVPEPSAVLLSLLGASFAASSRGVRIAPRSDQ